jgi:hypothetical protein
VGLPNRTELWCSLAPNVILSGIEDQHIAQGFIQGQGDPFLGHLAVLADRPFWPSRATRSHVRGKSLDGSSPVPRNVAALIRKAMLDTSCGSP